MDDTSAILDMWKKRDASALLAQRSQPASRDIRGQVEQMASQLNSQTDELTSAKAMKDALERELDAQADVSAKRGKTLNAMQERLQQHFSKTYDELNEFKKR